MNLVNGFVIRQTTKALLIICLVLVCTKATALNVYGNINQAQFYINDGNSTTRFFGNSNIADTKLYAAENGHFYRGVDLQILFGVSLRNNSSNLVNQMTTPSEIRLRNAELIFTFKNTGKFYIGHGEMISDYSSEVDITATSVAQYSEIYDVGEAFFFVRGDNTLDTNLTIGDAFNNLDGLGRIDRVRYDTPIYNGFLAGISYGEHNQYDIALKYDNQFKDFAFATAIAAAMQRDSRHSDGTYVIDGSFSLLFNHGLSITAAAGIGLPQEADIATSYTYYLKLGYQKKLLDMGQSAVSVDTGRYFNFVANNGTTYSVAFVQYIDKWNMQIYCAWRQFRLASNPIYYKNINSTFIGAYIYFSKEYANTTAKCCN